MVTDILNNYIPEADNIKEILMKHKKSKIAILDDIDFDGTMGMLIIKSNLEEILPDAVISVIHNNKHGLLNDTPLIEKLLEFDLIIVIDSSTNETHLLKGNKDVIVIDHHEMEASIEVPDNVLLINCKNMKGYESLSAGMLAYLLFRQITKSLNIQIEDHYVTACATLYSDIVPVDETVNALLDKFMECRDMPKLLKAMNTYNNPLNKNLLQWELIPLVNYTRRLEDKASLQTLITRDMEDYATINLKKNRSRAKTLIDLMYEHSNKKELDNLILSDITNTLKLSSDPLKNFKGLLSNKFCRMYKKPAVTGYVNNLDSKFYFSVRSPGYDSLTYFKSRGLEGGGHKFANGFSINPSNIKEVFEGFNTYLKRQEEIDDYITLTKLEDLKDLDIWGDVVKNEKAFSNIKPVKYLVPNGDLGITVPNKRNIINYKGIPFVTFNKLQGSNSLLITPTLSDYSKGSFELLVEAVN